MLSVSERTLWDMKRRGEIPYVPVGHTGRGVRFDVDDLRAAIEKLKRRNV